MKKTHCENMESVLFIYGFYVMMLVSQNYIASNGKMISK